MLRPKVHIPISGTIACGANSATSHLNTNECLCARCHKSLTRAVYETTVKISKQYVGGRDARDIGRRVTNHLFGEQPEF